ncbi:hypothetical protein C0993_010340 [Termitomyces sp. T159_Od127]|nr:hypothetical protein C0993_010340 [Termitomyces sp. T159_Od127]
MFVSDQLDLLHNPLDRLLELQLFDNKLTTTRPITKCHSSSIILDNGLWFLVSLLVMQPLETTPIVLELPWLHDVNSDINWRDLTMKFSSTSACLAAVHLCLQPTNDSSKTGATSATTAPLDDSGGPPPPQSILGAPLAFLSNIPHNKYKGPNYPAQHPQTTLDTEDTDQPTSPLNPEAFTIKIISPAPFTCILQDGTPALQIQNTPALLEEHLGADTTTPEPKTEEQILCEVVPPECHEFADVFSKMALHPHLTRSTTCQKLNSMP